jgi:hypothetical protein
VAGRRGAQQEAQVLKERVAVCTLILHCSLTVPHLLESFEKDTPCSHPCSSRPRSDLPIHGVVRYLNGCPARQELTRTRLNEQIDFKSVERGILIHQQLSRLACSSLSLSRSLSPTLYTGESSEQSMAVERR